MHVFSVEFAMIGAVQPHIISEHVTWTDGRGVTFAAGHDGNDHHAEKFTTTEQLLAIPGGPEALERWRAGDDTAYQAWAEYETALALAEDRRIAALSPAQEWDEMAAKYGREQIEEDWGPRPDES